MDNSLAINGMPELSLGTAVTETVGGSTDTVNSACSNLNLCVDNLNTFITNLQDQKDIILNGWEGTAADTLRQQFPGLIDAFNQIPASVRSLSDWAESTIRAYASLDDQTASAINQMIGGAK